MARQPLSRTRIVATAIERADREGLAALSMRTVASDLGVVPMALYRHVKDKDDLVSAMIDTVVASYPAPGEGDWREVLTSRAMSAREAIGRHPWLRSAVENASSKALTVLEYLDAATGDLLRAGMSADLAHYAMHAIGPRIWGYSPEGFDGPVVGDESAGGEAEFTHEERTAYAERFPAVAAVVADSQARHGGCDPASEFAFTLDLLLDGVARLHEAGWASPAKRWPMVAHGYGTPGGRRMLALHGLTEAGMCWPDLVARYPHWDVVAPDLRGHGESPRFADDELSNTPQVMLEDVVALLDAQREPVVLLGHSLGGLLALRAALARPERVAALILEDPAKPHADDMTPFIEQNEQFLDSLVTADQRASEIERMVRETSWTREEVVAWAESKPQVDRRYIREGMAMGAGPWEEAFEALTVPTLLVLPPHAGMAPGELANPLVTRVVIDHAGHCVRRDQPEAFYAAVDEFLGGLAG